MNPILTIIFSALLSGIIAWFIAEKRIRSEPELLKNRILLEMKVDIIKDIQSLLSSFMFNDRNDPEFLSWVSILSTLNITVAELMNDDSVNFMQRATEYAIMYNEGEINKREFSDKVTTSIVNASTCIKISTGFMEGPAPVPDETP